MNSLCFLRILVFLMLLGLNDGLMAQNIVYQGSRDSIGFREAILILPGLGDSKKHREAQIEEFKDKGYDVFIPEYMDKDSYANSLVNLEIFFKKYKLEEYKKLHCFVYIIGGWTLNAYINKHGFQNISTIISDRSPPQERAPYVVKHKLNLIGKLLKGKIVNQFAEESYVPIENPENVNIGLIIENKPTLLIKLFKRAAVATGPIVMHVDSLYQPNDDHMYVMLDHTEMYYRFDITSASIFNFIKTGEFLSIEQRVPFKQDVFEKD